MTLRQRLRNGERLNGCFVMLASPSIVELVGYAGFDFAIIDQEHGSIDRETTEHQIRAADAAGIEAIIRVPGADPLQIQHALDAGASGIMVPHVDTPEVARAVVHASYYPPRGERGYSAATRAGRHGTIGGAAAHIERAGDRTFVIAMIEDRKAFDHVGEIAGTPGIDAVFIGPMDLAMSMGHPGNPQHPDVADAIRRIAADALASGAQVMTFVSGPQHAAAVRSDMGIGIAVFSTAQLFAKALLDARRGIRELEEMGGGH